MSRRIDEIEFVYLTVLSFVVQRYALRLDRDTALSLQVHGIENLLGHLAICETTTGLYKPVRKRGLAVIYMCNDREITYVVYQSPESV